MELLTENINWVSFIETISKTEIPVDENSHSDYVEVEYNNNYYQIDFSYSVQHFPEFNADGFNCSRTEFEVSDIELFIMNDDSDEIEIPQILYNTIKSEIESNLKL